MSAEQIDLDGIRARAEAAHRGDWEAAKTIDGKWGVADSRALNPFAEDKWGAITVGVEMAQPDAEHIAGMDPSTTLALVDEVERLRAVVERVEAAAQDWEDDDDAHLVKHGQHLPGSVARMAELLRAAITGVTS